MSGQRQPAVTPVVAVMGGAGAMGSLFAELLSSAARATLLVDLFYDGSDGEGGRLVPPHQLAERLAEPLVAAGLDVVALTTGEDGRLVSVAVREARRAPVWLVASEPGVAGHAETLGTLRPATAAQVAVLPGVRRVFGLLSPAAAAEAASAANILVIATTYGTPATFRQMLQPYSAHMRPGSLVTNLMSVQAQPMDDLVAVFAPSIGLVGAHPLFGRVVGDVTGLVVALTAASDGRERVPWEQWLVRQLAGHGLLLTPSSAAEHDAAMSYVQALTHFCLLTFAFTFVRANQDPTALLPYRTPVFEPLLYLASRVASLAYSSPEVYRAIQAECARPEVRRLFVDTARDLLAAIEQPDGGELDTPAGLTGMFKTLGAPWSPAHHRYSEPFEHLVAMSGVLTERINSLRHALLQSAGRVVGLRHRNSGAVTLGALYVDPLHHDRVDLASRVRFWRYNLAGGVLEGPGPADVAGLPAGEARSRLEASLGSLPLAQVELLSDSELLDWLDTQAGPRTGAAKAGPARPRYAGKARFELSLAAPDWLDTDAATRLLVGRRDIASLGAGRLTRVTIARQQVPGWTPPAAMQAVIVSVVAVLHPEQTLALRAVARVSVQQQWGDDATEKQRRQHEDRAFAAALSAAHSAIREEVRAWLLAHGCQEVRL